MRLLNKSTLLLKQFADDDAPPFVILSHRWGADECTLQSFERESRLSTIEWSAGTAKIIAFCECIKDKPEQYVWVDACCIDKTNSVELQMAINLMYTWYQKAAYCLVFLEDVLAADIADSPGRDEFNHSRWWTRGWTLQELLAPRAEIFVNRDWKHIGSRDDLASSIEAITGIPASVFGNEPALHGTPVAQRMSWMSSRRTTVLEDVAYCMLGIFGVHMTFLYGEGDKAFLRLQEEIMKVVDDESIFLWTSATSENLRRSSILAPSPAHFAGFDKVPYRLDTYFLRDQCVFTSRGLQIEFFAPRSHILHDTLHIPLNCLRNTDDHRPYLVLQRSTDNVHGMTQWKRIGHEQIDAFQSHEYHVPPSDEEEYLKRTRAMEMEAHFAQTGQKRAVHFNQHHKVFEYKNECVRRKICVR